MQPIILTIAGSDPSGGAGIQADLGSIAANGGYGASVVTAITAQNTREVTRVEAVAPDLVRAQMTAVLEDLDVVAVKTGMLVSEDVIRSVAGLLREGRRRHVVCDPVFTSSSGAALLGADVVPCLCREIFSLADLVTPNADEAEILTGMAVRTPESAEAAGRMILEHGPGAVLVKGGHFEESPGTDVLVTRTGTRRFSSEWVDSSHTHGTGCIYSAAIATHLGRGLPLADAIGLSKTFTTEAIRGGRAVGRGIGPTDPFFFMRDGDGRAWLERLRRQEAKP